MFNFLLCINVVDHYRMNSICINCPSIGEKDDDNNGTSFCQKKYVKLITPSICIVTIRC